MPGTLLLGGARTPFGRFGGTLREVPSVELAASGMRAALARAGLAPADVDEVYSGVTIPAEEALDGSIPARVAMLRAGIPGARLVLTLARHLRQRGGGRGGASICGGLGQADSVVLEA